MNKKLFLKDGSKIVIVGGGPAGSFFANFALHLAKRKGIDISVQIFDRRSFLKAGQSGCNMCAGVISDSLYEKLKNSNIVIPKTKVQQLIDGYYFQTQECGVQLYHPQKHHKPHIMTVFRGGGPNFETQHENISFDDLLLHHAENHGAIINTATVQEIYISRTFGAPVDIVIIKDGIRSNIQADLVVGAFGLNTTIVKRMLGWKVKYKPPRSVHACNAELPLGSAYIKEHFGNNIYCFALGIDPIKFAAFTPKGDYVTVTLVGKKDVTKKHLIKFLAHPIIKDLLPENWQVPRNLCICFPKMPVTHAKSPYADRMVMVGDASISRFYKSGIESAFTTAQLAAKTAFENGVTADAFKNDYYRKARKLLARDNRFGHIIYGINGFVTKRKSLLTPYFKNVKKNPDSWVARRMNEILWGMVTGNIPYEKIFFKLVSPWYNLALAPITISTTFKEAISIINKAFLPKQKEKLAQPTEKDLGPLSNGSTVVIIGGGPAGTSCAISLLSRAKEKGIKINVVLYEWKPFDTITHNECAGVLSPPIKEIIENELSIPFPHHLVESHIKGYYLHSDTDVIKLEGGEDEISYGMRRSRFDKYMIDQARKAGADVIISKVTNIELGTNNVTVYSETKHTRADVIVGAFGLEEGTGKILEEESKYRTPRHLLTILTKYHPAGKFVRLPDDQEYIHAFLTSLKDIEFGAVSPKEDHYTINIAGAKIHAHSIQRFLALGNVQSVLPESFEKDKEKLNFHRGCFPIGPAKNLFGNRYVTIGDAAGLIRPFKGKGINSACLMGIKTAEVMIKRGISKGAFYHYFDHFSEIITDLPYARTIRRMVISAANRGYLSVLLDVAKKDKSLESALFYSVSGTKSYKKITLETANIPLLLKITKGMGIWFFNRYFRSKG